MEDVYQEQRWQHFEDPLLYRFLLIFLSGSTVYMVQAQVTTDLMMNVRLMLRCYETRNMWRRNELLDQAWRIVTRQGTNGLMMTTRYYTSFEERALFLY